MNHLHTITNDQRVFRNYECLQGEGVERLLVKGKKQGQTDEIDGDPYRYFLLAGTSHPYPDDTFYSVGRVPRKLLMKYLGVKMYLVRLKESPAKVLNRKSCAELATLMMTGVMPASSLELTAQT